MGEIKVKDKEVAVPGQVLATGMDFLPSYKTYRLGEEIRAQGLGIVKVEGKVLKIISLSGRYMPKRNDTIIAQVIDVLMSGWRFDINSAYSAMLPLKDASSRYIERGSDLTKIYALGDYVSCMVTNVTSQKLVDISMKGPSLRKLTGGRIIEVNTHKVPRIIGKQGSMVSLIKESTGCRIVVGQNGIIWIDGEPEKEVIAVNAIMKIEEEAHQAGLTDRIKKYLDEEIAKLGKK
ncbi:exosome complex RNA-binding protein Rrp4 [candidate division KSB1 bacterium]